MPTSPSAPGAAVAARLDALRGPVPPRSHDARTIAALTVNPGCSRRAVLDAAGIDKRRLAERVGSPARFGQSPFAITRGLMFEKQIKADACAQLLDLLRTELGFDVPEHEYVDLGGEQGSVPTARSAPASDEDAGTPAPAAPDGGIDRATRHRRTRDLFARVATGAAVLADHPLLTLDVAGRTAYVEPDVVALRARRADSGSDTRSLLYIAEVKSFSVIDGQADPTKVGAAATQAAVYVLALRRLFAALGADPDLVASDVVLVCPKDFSNRPTAHLVDVRRQIAAVSRQLDRLPRIEALVAELDPAIDFDLSVDQTSGAQDAPHPHRSTAELAKSLSMIEARYAPECVTRCELAFHCRGEARSAGSADALGRSVRDALGGIESIDEVLRIASGDAPAARRSGGDEAARLLRAAARAYDEAAAMVRVPEAATDRAYDEAAAMTPRVPEAATDRAYDEAAAMTPRVPEAATDRAYDEAAAMTPRVPEAATDRAYDEAATAGPRRVPEAEVMPPHAPETTALANASAATPQPRTSGTVVSPRQPDTTSTTVSTSTTAPAPGSASDPAPSPEARP